MSAMLYTPINILKLAPTSWSVLHDPKKVSAVRFRWGWDVGVNNFQRVSRIQASVEKYFPAETSI